jgi:protein-S-isoprenylcysteine O-methyltransferase Ste14
MEEFVNTLLAYPILGVIFVSLVVSLVVTLVKKLLKIAVGLGIIIIALAIVLHYFGHDTLPQEGKDVLQKAEEILP